MTKCWANKSSLCTVRFIVKSVVAFSTHWPQSAPFWPYDRPQWFCLMSLYWPYWHLQKTPHCSHIISPNTAELFFLFFFFLQESPYWVFLLLSSQEFLQTAFLHLHSTDSTTNPMQKHIQASILIHLIRYTGRAIPLFSKQAGLFILVKAKT